MLFYLVSSLTNNQTYKPSVHTSLTQNKKMKSITITHSFLSKTFKMAESFLVSE